MTLPRQWQKHALALIERASPLEGEFFRSVELAYAHPDDVTSGEGTRLYGGRFVRPGVRAFYGSLDEETAFRESAARMHRLAGVRGARLTSYPRVTYVVAVKAASHVDLTATQEDAGAILPACIDTDDLTPSQEVGEFFRTGGIHAVAFPSAIPGFRGRNLVVFADGIPAPSLVFVNRAKIMDDLHRLARRLAD